MITSMSQSIDTDLRIYIVGGFVRDKLMGKKPNDIDIIAHDKIFQQVTDYIKQKSQIYNIEILAEHKLKSPHVVGCTLFEFKFKDLCVEMRSFAGSIYDDNKTRDFTMNSIYAYGPTLTINDICGGIQDLKSKTIK